MYGPGKMYNNVKNAMRYLPQVQLNNQNMQNRQGFQNMQNIRNMQNVQSQSSSSYDWLSDLDTSASHGSFGGFSSFGTASCFSIDICPDLLLGAIAVAATGAGFLIYTAIVAAGRRRKRNSDDYFTTFFSSGFEGLLTLLGSYCNEDIFKIYISCLLKFLHFFACLFLF